MNINTASQKGLQGRLKEQAKAGREGFKRAFADAQLGKAQPNDEQFRIWFEMRSQPLTPMGEVNPYFNPNWIRALEFVEGGKAMLGRYQRISNPQPPPLVEPGRGPLRFDEPFRPSMEVPQ